MSSFMNWLLNFMYTPRSNNRWTEPAEIAITAFTLGAVGCASLVLIVLYFLDLVGLWVCSAGCYLLLAHTWFHMSEFVVAAQYRPHDCHPEAFMIYHSKAWVVAHLFAWCEFLIEYFLIPDEWKFFRMHRPTIVALGVVGVIVFYSLRVIAMVQCGVNFALKIEHERRDEHRLCRDGLYRYFRHPAYFAWFYHAMFSQLIFGNPISFVGFTVATWVFFADRIPYEEEQLASEEFFGDEYKKFKRDTIIGIPFIRT